jgi:hypothetical protein
MRWDWEFWSQSQPGRAEEVEEKFGIGAYIHVVERGLIVCHCEKFLLFRDTVEENSRFGAENAKETVTDKIYLPFRTGDALSYDDCGVLWDRAPVRPISNANNTAAALPVSQETRVSHSSSALMISLPSLDVVAVDTFV